MLYNGHYGAILTTLRPNVVNEVKYDFSEMYFELGRALVLRKDSPRLTLKEMKGHSIGIATGSSLIFNALRKTGANIYELTFVTYDSNTGRAFRVVNAHIPGNPNLPVRDEFARYIYDIHRNGQVTVALGDNNFERDKMILAYEKMGFLDFSLHSPWKTNNDPYGKHSKAIDHLLWQGPTFCVILRRMKFLKTAI